MDAHGWGDGVSVYWLAYKVLEQTNIGSLHVWVNGCLTDCMGEATGLQTFRWLVRRSVERLALNLRRWYHLLTADSSSNGDTQTESGESRREQVQIYRHNSRLFPRFEPTVSLYFACVPGRTVPGSEEQGDHFRSVSGVGLEGSGFIGVQTFVRAQLQKKALGFVGILGNVV